MTWLRDFKLIYEQLRGAPFNSTQWDVISAGSSECLHVVAGPGTGKTTSMVGRILKLVFHDQIAPASILATTFTKKAAEELRSRILSQGLALKSLFLSDPSLPNDTKQWIQEIDINQILTGTLDSICQNILRESKQPGASDPEPVDEYVASTVMFRDGLLFSGDLSDQDLETYLRGFHGRSSFNYTAIRKGDLIEEIYKRWNNDLINFNHFEQSGSQSEQNSKSIIRNVIDRYQARLDELGAMDFVQLEAEVLRRFQNGQLNSWRDRLQVLIIDEYQDTNLLQEQIYFEMAHSCKIMSVVGDDDQSLYRFRGATVELFVDFPNRLNARLRSPSNQYFLRENYRSTQPIVDLVNGYADLDHGYQTVRVPPPRGGVRGIICQSPIQPVFPVLGLFRPDLVALANDLAELIHEVFRGPGRMIPGVGNLIRDASNGDLGDCCMLGYSHREFTGDRARLPHHLRESLATLNPPIGVFNPRGRPLANIDQVALFGGYIIRVIDPYNTHLGSSAIGRYDARTHGVLQDWWNTALSHYNAPNTSQELRDFISNWCSRTPEPGKNWPRRVSILEFLNGLRHFFPFFRDDPEGLLYYEVFTRQFQACQRIGSWDGNIVSIPTNPSWEERAAFDLIEFMLGPIASGTVGVNEDLIDSFPRNRFSIMSIHQSKGLEFPMVVVDIGSDFNKNSPQQRKNRAPEDGESSHLLESVMRPYSSGIGVPNRPAVDRAYDDLIRKFFVAFSRPEQVLVLVGLDKSRPHNPVPTSRANNSILHNVAAGDDRNGTRLWPNNVPIHYL